MNFDSQRPILTPSDARCARLQEEVVHCDPNEPQMGRERPYGSYGISLHRKE